MFEFDPAESIATMCERGVRDQIVLLKEQVNDPTSELSTGIAELSARVGETIVLNDSYIEMLAVQSVLTSLVTLHNETASTVESLHTRLHALTGIIRADRRRDEAVKPSTDEGTLAEIVMLEAMLESDAASDTPLPAEPEAPSAEA